MKKELTYNEAYLKLEEIVEQLEEGKIPLDKLSLTVKQASEFISICENKLRNIQENVNKASEAINKRKPRKNNR